MPKPSAAAKVVLIGSDETTAVSTVTIGSQDVAVGVGTITVEPGTEPIYLVVTSYRPTIWRLYGAVARIERLVLTSTMPAPAKDVPADKPLVGATGVPAERVTFLQHTECVGHFETVPSRQATLAAIAVKIDSGMKSREGRRHLRLVRSIGPIRRHSRYETRQAGDRQQDTGDSQRR